MRKIVLLVVALLAVVLVAAALQSRKDDREVDLQSHKLLSEQQLQILADTQAITLQRGQQEVKLVRQDDQWLVANSDNFPVLQPRLAALLLNLRGAEVQEEKTDNPDYHQRLGLSADSELPVLQVTLDAGDTTLGLLYVSNVPLEQIAKARWEHADGETLVLDKAEQGDYNFRLAGEASAEGQERKLNSMVLALANLQAQNVSLRSKLALGQPGLSMQLDTWSGAQLAASLYQLDNQYWLTVDAVKQSDEQPLDVRIDPRWAYQLSVAQHDQLALRAADLQPAEVEVGE